MKYAPLVSLALAGCVCASEREPMPLPSGQAERSVQCALDAQAPELKHYPPAELRSDLGERPIECEAQRVAESIKSVENVIRLRAMDKDNIGRGDHAKPIGCYEATFTVSSRDVVSLDHQVGIATSANLGKSFPAIVRLSNSEPKNVSDYRSATVGLAVRVALDDAQYSNSDYLSEGHKEQDFIAGGLDRAFVSSDIARYADLFELRIHPVSNALRIKSRHPEAFREFGSKPLLRLFNLTSSDAPMILGQRFWSLVPYAWGDWAVKYLFDPCPGIDRRDVSFSRFDNDYQGKAVAQFLERTEICYVMKIQVRPRAATEEEKISVDKAFPIEDAMVKWPEPGTAANWLSAEFREVARLRIKAKQEARPPQECERREFNPWNGLKAHQPLGSLNRARGVVYRESARVRSSLYEATPDGAN